MAKFFMAVLIVLCIDVMAGMAQYSVDSINPATAPHFYNYEGSQLQQFDKGNYTAEGAGDFINNTPEGTNSNSVGAGSNNGWSITDTWQTMKSWATNVAGGLRYLVVAFGGITFFLKTMGLDPFFVFIVNVLWYAMTVVLALMWWWGRE